MNENVIVSEVVKKALGPENIVVEDIKRIGGMTNINYSGKINKEHFIIRIPGKGTDELVNRKSEHDNLLFATSLGINPEFRYFDMDTGLKITHEIERPITLTDTLAKSPPIMQKIVDLFLRLHHSGLVMNNRFELRKLMSHYENLVFSINPFLREKYTDIQGEITDLLSTYESFSVEEVPCHIDTGCFNFILSDSGKLYLIDWEYSGMFDGVWDIAAFMQESEFTVDEERKFLLSYFQREPHRQELQRLYMHKIFQDYLWSLWSLYKELNGAFPGKHDNLIARAKDNISAYWSLFTENDAV